MTALIDLTGQKFGKWFVFVRAANSRDGSARWHCQCDCGTDAIVMSGNLLSGGSTQCLYCRNKENPFKHGLAGTPVYGVWKDMIARCKHPNHKYYRWYGARGIKVCAEWHDPLVFVAWALANGYRDDLTIDKIDNAGEYGPDNCQFITKSENSLKAWHVDNAYENSDFRPIRMKQLAS